MPISTKLHDTTSSLRSLVECSGPFITAVAPSPSEHADSDHRYDVIVRDLASSLSDRWDPSVSDELVEAFAAFDHDDGEAVVVVRPSEGPTYGEAIGVGVRSRYIDEGDHPRLAPLIEARQQSIAHVVIVTDKSGADITAFEAGRVLDEAEIEVENRHIHRGRQGGWSHRRYQQRAENTWHDNADNVAESALEMARGCGADVFFVVGPPRAQSMVVERLGDEAADGLVIAVESGDPELAADEIQSAVADHVASLSVELIEEFRQAVADGQAANDVDEIDRALTEGRVDVLLVNDDPDRRDESSRVDEFVARAIRTDALVRVVPRIGDLDDGVAAIYRW